MAGGEQHAKQTLVDETERLSAQLRNGHSGDITKIGELLILVTKMMVPMYMNVFVTAEECDKKSKKGVLARMKIGPVSIQAPVMFIAYLLPYVGLVFILGKSEGWW